MGAEEMKSRVHEQGVVCFGVFVRPVLDHQQVQFIFIYTPS